MPDVTVAVDSPANLDVQDAGHSVEISVNSEILTGSQDSSAINRVVLPFGETIGGHRVVKVETGRVYLADWSRPLDAGRVIGVTPHAVMSGAQGEVITFGELQHLGWSWWRKGFLFLGANGEFSVTPPETGLMLPVATVLTTNKILVNIHTGIIKNA